MAAPLVTPRASAGSVADFGANFGTWMAAEQRRVFALCHRLLQDPDEASSATQDTFLKAYQAMRKEDARELDDPARWITRIAVNTCLDRLRSHKWQFWRRRPRSTPWLNQQPSSHDEGTTLALIRSSAPEAEDRYFAAQISSRLESALDRLSARQRAVFTLRHYDDLSLDEIGDALGLDIGTVKAHMFRAVSKLRTELRDLYEGSR
jgi:RNA polymerase sigma-70 factor (ECF subfamily)